MDYIGVKLAEDPASTQAWPACSQKWTEDCSSTGCCADWGMQCYQKDDNWASCKSSCEAVDEKNESWSCQTIYPPQPLTMDNCRQTCQEDSGCREAIFDANAKSCLLSPQRIPEVVWAADNFNTTVCGDAGSEPELHAIIDTVSSVMPWEEPLPEPQMCSWGGEDCSQTKCCNDVSCDAKFTNCYAYSCYKQTEYFSGCQLSTPPADWDGTWLGGGRVHKAVGAAGKQVAVKGTSLYCFAVINWNAPAPKPFWSTEAQLADNIKKNGLSIFQCDGHDFYDGAPTPKAEWGSFSNIDAFQQIWKEVQGKGSYRNFDWTVKVDADAVFLPNRLKMHLVKLRTPLGARVYLENVNYQFKFMGALEVVTTEALDLFLEQSHTCLRGVHAGGEDFFMKGCMDALGVDHMSDFDLLRDKYAAQDGPCNDGWGVAYHFHKKVISWNWCYNEAVCGSRGKSCPQGIDVEFVMPWKPNVATR